MAQDSTDQVRHLRELIKDIKFCMLTTVAADGSLHSRPMATQQTEFDGDLWFFTGMNTQKVPEIKQDDHVNVSFADPDGNRYVSLSGRANLIRDRAKAEELWNPAYRAWFPNGLDEPDLTLLKVEVDRAEYWDSPSSVVANTIGFIKAIATGKRYEGGDHAQLKL